MAVKYHRLNFSSRDHERVSGVWLVLLWDITHHDHVHYNVNEGHRTMARQAELVREKGLWSPSNPTGAAAPSPTAPHIRSGRFDHANDFDNAEGVRQAAHHRGVTINFPLAREPWHGDPDHDELLRYYRKNHRRVWRERAKKKIKHPIKTVVRIPTHASNELVDFLISWEGASRRAYKVPGETFWTIGVGHTSMVNGEPIHGGMVISNEMVHKLLRGDLANVERDVERLVPLRWRRHQRHYDAMVSLAFNMGSQILTAAPPLTSFGEVLKKPVNQRTINEACEAIKLYNKGGSPLRVMDGLVRRRRAEVELFRHKHYVHN